MTPPRRRGDDADDADDAAAYDGGNTTGFVSPAGDALEGVVDLAAVLDLRRPHRYAVRVAGERLRERGIFPGDVLTADTAAAPAAGRVCIAFVNGDVLLATLAHRGGQWWLRPSSPERAPVAVGEDTVEVWAIVAALVRPKV